VGGVEMRYEHDRRPRFAAGRDARDGVGPAVATEHAPAPRPPAARVALERPQRAQRGGGAERPAARGRDDAGGRVAGEAPAVRGAATVGLDVSVGATGLRQARCDPARGRALAGAGGVAAHRGERLDVGPDRGEVGRVGPRRRGGRLHDEPQRSGRHASCSRTALAARSPERTAPSM
jgi:hypothetical protein